MIQRRGLLGAALAAMAAPAIITTPGLLMPVRRVIVPQWGDGVLTAAKIQEAMRRLEANQMSIEEWLRTRALEHHQLSKTTMRMHELMRRHQSGGIHFAAHGDTITIEAPPTKWAA